MSTTDPSSFLSSPPSTVVKVVNTSRAELNGLLGIAVQFDAGRGRYLIHMVGDQQTMALKPENLVKASTFESLKAQYDQLSKDPRVKKEITKYYNLVQSKTGVKPEYFAGSMVACILVGVYFLGFTKVLMLLSTVLLIAIVAAPDLVTGVDLKTVISNFPMRSREAMEQSVPFLKGKLTNLMAVSVVALMVILCFKSLIFTKGTGKAAASLASKSKTAVASVSALSREQLENAYKFGFDDASNGKDFGFSSVDVLVKANNVASLDATVADEYIAGGYSTADYAPPPQRSFVSKIGISQAMSAFYLYRTAMEIGVDAHGTFSPQFFMAQLRTQEVWRLGILGFTLYNLVKVLF
jgi:hypothetical protein